MYKNKKIAAIVRAYNEEKFIASVINAIPVYVDNIYIINDASTDSTFEIVNNISKINSKVIVINHLNRRGAGSAAISGQKKALADNNDIAVILDGDGQMNPCIIECFLEPIILGKADYVKGNRLSQRKDREEMPAWRSFGNFLLTYLTRIASGYWHISDPQNGYTAIVKETLKQINLDTVERGFAFENDMLVKLNVVGAKVVDVNHEAIYRGQRSKINYSNFIIRTSWILLRDSLWRMWTKYLTFPFRNNKKKTNKNTIFS